MPKGKEIKVGDEGLVPEPVNPSDREARWAAHVENYAKKNPVKFAAKKARGEFDKIPDTFK